MYEPASYGPPDKSAVPAASADEHALDGELVRAPQSSDTCLPTQALTDNF
jgi:hypothetical protein